MHKNYNPKSCENKYEFGDTRSYSEQKKDIIMGWLRLYGAFKKRFAPIFVPPFHFHDLKTLQIINRLGQRKNIYIFSAGKKTLPKHKNFLDIPAYLTFSPPKNNAAGYLNEWGFSTLTWTRTPLFMGQCR